MIQFDDTLFSQLKDLVNQVGEKIDTLKSFFPVELLPFVGAGLVVSVLYLILGRNND